MKMNEKKEKLFTIITLMLCLILFLERLTGEICHVVFGMLLLVMTLVHVCRRICKLKHKRMSVKVVDWIMMAAFAVVILSGMLLHPLQGVLAVKVIHKLFSVFLVVGIIVHVIQHKKNNK